MQAAYSEQKTLLNLLRLSDFATVVEFDDADQRIFSTFHAYASSARRSSIDFLDRGLMILLNLPVPLKRELDRLARKREIPENCMDRCWVITELIRLESRALPEFIFWKRNKTPAPAPAAPTDVALLPAATDDDAVTITCLSQQSPGCEKTFTESTSRWLALKDSTGRAFQVPKSCGPCRKLKRQMWNLHQRNPVPDSTAVDTAIMTVAIDVDIDPDDDFVMADYASRFFFEP